MGNLKKGSLEKVYTPNKITEFIINNMVTDKEKITEILEPAAGNGMMADVIKKHFPEIPIISYDIKNESKRKDIIECDFLKNDEIKYKKGRITIMNPPFSRAINFIYKTLEVSDVCYCITGSSTFLNLNYDKYDLEDIYIIKNATFADGKKYKISLMKIKKK